MKIDISKIEGYDSMSAEEKLAALEAYEIDYSGHVRKDLFDKASSEIAKLKAQLKEKMSDEERLKAEQQESLESMKKELEQLKAEKMLNEYKAQYLSLGYDDALATSTAKAYMDGDMATVFANQKTHQDTIAQKVKANLVDNTPQPKVNNNADGMTKEKIRAMSPGERATYAREHFEEYRKIMEN